MAEIKKIRLFWKKDAEIFAGSEKVPTFASAFKKNGVPVKFENNPQGWLKAGWNTGDSENAKVLEKSFGDYKNLLYLCSPFAIQNARFFQQGSLNYWLYFERKEM